jgi:hypothetical protein
MALESTQPLAETSAKCISWGKGGRCVRLTTLPPFCVDIMKSGNLNFLEPSEPLQACNGTAVPILSQVLQNAKNFLAGWVMFGVLENRTQWNYKFCQYQQVHNSIYEGCPESIRPLLISREPVTWP